MCLGIIDMGIGSQEAMAAMAARAARAASAESPSMLHFEASEASPCVRATAGSPQELEFGASSAPEILVIQISALQKFVFCFWIYFKSIFILQATCPLFVYSANLNIPVIRI